jgi:hypothetical protein
MLPLPNIAPNKINPDLDQTLILKWGQPPVESGLGIKAGPVAHIPQSSPSTSRQQHLSRRLPEDSPGHVDTCHLSPHLSANT